MDLTRDEVLEILESMRVEVPRDTKLPLEALNQRLIRALELAQVSPKSKEIDPCSLRRWSDVPTSKVMIRAVMGAANQGEWDKLNQASQTLFNPFMKFRVTVSEIAQFWYEGSKIVLLDDPARKYCIKIHFVDVFALSDNIPIVVFHYEHGPTTSFHRSVDTKDAKLYKAMSVTCPTTIQLLLRLLRINSRRLSSSFKPPIPQDPRFKSRKEKRASGNTSTNPTLSFLLPVLPLTMREAGGLSNAAGCEVCGALSVSRCAACQYTAYCGKECQKADWVASHKTECKKRALASGTWVNVDISTPGYTDDHHERARNEFSLVDSCGMNLKKENMNVTNWPPPNIYGDTPFVVKIIGPNFKQGSGFAPLEVYDRRRSLEISLRFQADRVGYEALFRTLQTLGHLDSRTFLFARRTASATLSVCLDRDPPAELVKW